MTDVTLIRAVLAGIISFISPCVLLLIPAYSSLIAGLSWTGDEERISGKRVVFISLSFLSGFLLIFVLSGTSSSFGSQAYLRVAGALLTILSGVYMAAIVVFRLLQKMAAMPSALRVSAYPLALLIGIGFASGWTPCIGSTLGAILISANTQGTAAQGSAMLIMYSIGLAMPFLALALIIKAVMNSLRGKGVIAGMLMTAGGIVLIVMGAVLLMDYLRNLTPLFPDLVSY